MSKPAKWWHAENNRVVCELCPRHCRLTEGQRGFCFVRQNLKGEMTLSTYGKSTGFCIDPIEKKPLNHFLPGTPVLSFGTAGCNLGCKFCQNWDMSKSQSTESLSQDAGPEAIVSAAKHAGCRGIAFTYNDPIVWAEYAIDTAKKAHQENIKTIAVTSGYISPKAREDFFEHIDAANVDLKSFDEDFYRKLTLAHLKPVLDTLKWLKEKSKVWFEITNLIIPEENDSNENIRELCHWVMDNLGADVPLHFSAFHPDYKMKGKPRTPHETLTRAYDLAKELGLHHVYVGNVLDETRQNTFCQNCQAVVIERNHYELGAFSIKNGKCSQCETSVPGIYEETCGTWGRTRLRLQISDDDALPLEPSTSALNEGSAVQIASARKHIDEASDAVNQITEKSTSKALNPPNAFRSFPEVAPKTDLSDTERASILHYTRELVQSAVTKKTCNVELPPDLANSPAYGIFVTLQRGVLLRACRGHWGDPQSTTLGALLESAAMSTATTDSRFPSISPQELPMLSIEVSLMHNPQIISELGAARQSAIRVGTHGLVISHAKGRGLLLPHVAVENKWNVKIFLERVSTKAGLPPDTWLSSDAQLMTFQTRLLKLPARYKELAVGLIPPDISGQLLSLANALLANNVKEFKLSAALAEQYPQPMGIVLEDASGVQATTLRNGTSLLELTRQSVLSLRQTCSHKQIPLTPIQNLHVLSQQVPLNPNDYPTRFGTLPHTSILVKKENNLNLSLPKADRRNDVVGKTLSSLGVSLQDWLSGTVQVASFQTSTFSSARPKRSVQGRQPMGMGSFYPKEPEVLLNELKGFLQPNRNIIPSEYRAVMLPHAGWRYCADIIGKTLQQVKIPNRVIVIGPKHTPHGAHWSVSADPFWLYPHTAIAVDSELANVLEKEVPRLERETEAHRIEHGSEVILPFIHQLNPKAKVVPIALGYCSFEDLEPLSQAFGKLLAEEEAPLIVISSDLNHYAPEEENRRLDNLALDALRSGQPRTLYDTCTNNHISMCGMLPTTAVMQALLYNSSEIHPEVVDYANSSRVTKDFSRVVGYAGALIR